MKSATTIWIFVGVVSSSFVSCNLLVEYQKKQARSLVKEKFCPLLDQISATCEIGRAACGAAGTPCEVQIITNANDRSKDILIETSGVRQKTIARYRSWSGEWYEASLWPKGFAEVKANIDD